MNAFVGRDYLVADILPARSSAAGAAAHLVPGIALCAIVTAISYGMQQLEFAATGHAWVEALVLAILVGTAIRTFWTPSITWMPGINFSAKLLLEIAVVLLGASVSASTIFSVGWELLVSILGIVAGAILLSYAIGRTLGLKKRLAILVACGNSICGNSAIAAVAPIIGADCDDVASSIAFTAVLGVVVVILLPLIGAVLGMSQIAYGALAGLTVYAIPQVLAAAAPLGAKAVQIGTLVKLIRVLMLGPVCLALSLMTTKLRKNSEMAGPVASGDQQKSGRPKIHQLIPWFIIGFLAMIGLRSANLLPAAALVPIGETATVLTVISMAALGLGVDIRMVTRAGGPVTATVVLSLLILGLASFALVSMLGL